MGNTRLNAIAILLLTMVLMLSGCSSGEPTPDIKATVSSMSEAEAISKLRTYFEEVVYNESSAERTLTRIGLQEESKRPQEFIDHYRRSGCEPVSLSSPDRSSSSPGKLCDSMTVRVGNILFKQSYGLYERAKHSQMSGHYEGLGTWLIKVDYIPPPGTEIEPYVEWWSYFESGSTPRLQHQSPDYPPSTSNGG